MVVPRLLYQMHMASEEQLSGASGSCLLHVPPLRPMIDASRQDVIALARWGGYQNAYYCHLHTDW